MSSFGCGDGGGGSAHRAERLQLHTRELCKPRGHFAEAHTEVLVTHRIHPPIPSQGTSQNAQNARARHKPPHIALPPPPSRMLLAARQQHQLLRPARQARTIITRRAAATMTTADLDLAALAAAPLGKGSARPALPPAGTLLFLTTASCPYAQRTWLALNEARVSYKPVFVDLQNKAEWHLELNPFGRVPTLAWAGEDGSTLSIYESLVADELANDLSKGALLPRTGGAAAAAGCRLLIDQFGQRFGSAFGGLMFAEDGSEKASEAAGKVKEALQWLEQNTAGEEGGAASPSSSSPKALFLLGQDGGAFTLADAAIYPFVARLVGVMPRLSPKSAAEFADLKKAGYPRLAAWLATTASRPGVRATEVAPAGGKAGASYWDYLEETYVAYRERQRAAAAK